MHCSPFRKSIANDNLIISIKFLHRSENFMKNTLGTKKLIEEVILRISPRGILCSYTGTTH